MQSFITVSLRETKHKRLHAEKAAQELCVAFLLSCFLFVICHTMEGGVVVKELLQVGSAG